MTCSTRCPTAPPSATPSCHRRRPKAIVAVRLEQGLPVELLPAAEGGTVASCTEPQAAAWALAPAARRAAWLTRPAGRAPDLDGIETQRAHDVVKAYFDRHPDSGWLDPRDCAELLGCYGIPQLAWAWTDTEDAPSSPPTGCAAPTAGS